MTATPTEDQPGFVAERLEPALHATASSVPARPKFRPALGHHSRTDEMIRPGVPSPRWECRDGDWPAGQSQVGPGGLGPQTHRRMGMPALLCPP